MRPVLRAALVGGLIVTAVPATASSVADDRPPTRVEAATVAAASVAAVTVAAPATVARPTVARPGPGSVSVLHVPADGGTRDVWVYRPSVPDAATLPVLYFLHGLPGSAADVFNDGVAAILDQYVAGGGMPFVLASPDGSGRAHIDTEWADAADGSERIESYVTGAVIDAVEGSLRRPRGLRAIAGFSMGGYGAANLAIRHPDLYGAFAAIGGYFHVDDPSGMFAGNGAIIAANSPDQRAAAAKGESIFLLDADGDNDPLIHGEAQRFKSVLDQTGVPATLVVTPGLHRWRYVMREFPRMLTWLATSWTAAASPATPAPADTSPK